VLADVGDDEVVPDPHHDTVALADVNEPDLSALVPDDAAGAAGTRNCIPMNARTAGTATPKATSSRRRTMRTTQRSSSSCR
jgi:hypothetical protein